MLNEGMVREGQSEYNEMEDQDDEEDDEGPSMLQHVKEVIKNNRCPGKDGVRAEIRDMEKSRL